MYILHLLFTTYMSFTSTPISNVIFICTGRPGRGPGLRLARTLPRPADEAGPLPRRRAGGNYRLSAVL